MSRQPSPLRTRWDAPSGRKCCKAPTREKKKMQKARELLSRAGSHRGLSPHRREKAQEILERML
jgi:hypothetical protein